MNNSSQSGGEAGGALRRNGLPAILCTIAIVVLSLWPKPPEPPTALRIPHLDKAVHVVMYAGYAVVLAWTFRAAQRTWRMAVALAVSGAVFGVAMELIQAAVPVLERTLSGTDMVANAVGSVVGVALYGGAARRSCRSF